MGFCKGRYPLRSAGADRKGGRRQIIEYTGEGVKSLSVTDRATITNMGAELGATTSVFPSDENTRLYLKEEGREEDYTPLAGDPDAVYDEELIVDLDQLTPLAAMPHSPDNVDSVSNIGEIKVDQVAIGSCTNLLQHGSDESCVLSSRARRCIRMSAW